jgi:hypothetical protein
VAAVNTLAASSEAQLGCFTHLSCPASPVQQQAALSICASKRTTHLMSTSCITHQPAEPSNRKFS